jgi:hypothetical protein
MKPAFFNTGGNLGNLILRGASTPAERVVKPKRAPRSLREWFKRHPERTQLSLAREVKLRPPTTDVGQGRPRRASPARRCPAAATGLPFDISSAILARFASAARPHPERHGDDMLND